MNDLKPTDDGDDPKEIADKLLRDHLQKQINELLDKLAKPEHNMDNKAVAEVLGISPSTLSRYKNKEQPIDKLQEILTALKALESILARGGRPKKSYLYLNNVIYELFKTLSSKRRYIRILIGCLILGLAVISPLLWPDKLETAKSMFSSKAEEGVILNLVLSLLVLVGLHLYGRISISWNCSQEIQKSMSYFLITWYGIWVSWFLLFVVLLMLQMFWLNNHYLLVLADLLNVASSICLFSAFYTMYYAKSLSEKVVWSSYAIFIAFGVLISFSSYVIELKFISESIPYLAGVALLFLIGRLDSLHIKIPGKLFFLFCLYLYALFQLGWKDLNNWTLLWALGGKLMFILYVGFALISGGKLEQYFQRLHKGEQLDEL